MGLKERLSDIGARVVFGPKVEGEMVEISGQDCLHTETFHFDPFAITVKSSVRTDNGDIHSFQVDKLFDLYEVVPNFNTSSMTTELARVKINQRGNWWLLRRVKGTK